jgi:hypothetical protein
MCGANDTLRQVCEISETVAETTQNPPTIMKRVCSAVKAASQFTPLESSNGHS